MGEEQANCRNAAQERAHRFQQQSNPPVSQRKGAHPLPDTSGCRGGPCTAWKATGTMRLGLVVLAMIFLSSMGHSDVLKLSKARRQRRGKLSLFHCVSFVSHFFFFCLQMSCFSLLESHLLWWTSYKHLTSEVKITFSLFSHHSHLFFIAGYVGFRVSSERLIFLALLGLCLPQFM